MICSDCQEELTVGPCPEMGRYESLGIECMTIHYLPHDCVVDGCLNCKRLIIELNEAQVVNEQHQNLNGELRKELQHLRDIINSLDSVNG